LSPHLQAEKIAAEERRQREAEEAHKKADDFIAFCTRGEGVL